MEIRRSKPVGRKKFPGEGAAGETPAGFHPAVVDKIWRINQESAEKIVKVVRKNPKKGIEKTKKF